MSTSVLGDQLRNLEDVGVISKGEIDVKKSRIRYSLTEKGIALLPLMVEMIVWSGTFDNKTAAGKDFLKKAKNNKLTLLSALSKKLKREHLS